LNGGNGNATVRSSALGGHRLLSRWWLAISHRAGFFTVGLVAFCVVAGFRAHSGLLGVRGPDAYWALHWTRDYSNGFVRRGLLGEMLRLLGIDATDYLVITVLAWSASLALALLLIEAAFRLSRGLNRIEATLFLLVLAISPATDSLIAETTGDPLQLLLAAYMVVHWLVFVARPLGAGWAAALFGLFGLIAGLIHEGTLFLVFPAAVITALVLVRTTAARAAAGAYLLGSAIAVGSVLLMSQQAASSVAGGYIHVGAASMVMPDNSFQSFSELLAIENATNFGQGIAGYLLIVKRLVGSLLVPFYLACLVSAVSFGAADYGSGDRQRVWVAFAIPVLLSAPLYLIAHDWGRFGGYAIMQSLLLLGFWRTEKAPRPNSDRVGILGITLALALAMLPMQSLDDYRVNGLYVDYRFISLGVLVVVAIALLYRRFWRAQLGL
jgi:hypothetical protein